MAFINVQGMHGCGNSFSHCKASLDRLRTTGEVRGRLFCGMLGYWHSGPRDAASLGLSFFQYPVLQQGHQCEWDWWNRGCPLDLSRKMVSNSS
jgi:hypothetical protein